MHKLISPASNPKASPVTPIEGHPENSTEDGPGPSLQYSQGSQYSPDYSPQYSLGNMVEGLELAGLTVRTMEEWFQNMARDIRRVKTLIQDMELEVARTEQPSDNPADLEVICGFEACREVEEDISQLECLREAQTAEIERLKAKIDDLIDQRADGVRYRETYFW